MRELSARLGPALVAASHGTRSPAGRALTTRLALALQSRRPGLVVRQAFVDVQRPTVAERVTTLAAEGVDTVVVPLLLSTGVHVRVDVAAAVDAAAGLPGRSVAAAHLGVAGALAPAVEQRLREAGVADDDTVVVAAAGSADEAAGRDVEAVAEVLRHRRDGGVSVGYLAPAPGNPSVAEAVLRARNGHGGTRVAVAAYLLAPGHFASRLAGVGADVVSAPLGLHAAVLARALRSYDEAAAELGHGGRG